MSSLKRARSNLKALNNFGIRVRLDDFGIGWSSLNILKNLSINSLTIAQSLIENVSDKLDRSSLVKAILAMARVLNILVVAKGVETDDQLSFLCSHGCNALQGFLFSPPLSPSQVDELLSDRAKIDKLRNKMCKLTPAEKDFWVKPFSK